MDDCGAACCERLRVAETLPFGTEGEERSDTDGTEELPLNDPERKR